MSRSMVARAPASIPTRVGLRPQGDPRRSNAEAFVRRIYAATYGAELTELMPCLVELRDDAGNLLGALGLREAATETLFLEHYLDAPVESCVSAAAGEGVAREMIVEVGNLAVGEVGGGRWLITALTAFIHARGKQWVTFTCGPKLYNAFIRMGLQPLDLGPALPARLSSEEAARWGGYYQQRPRVMAGPVEQGYLVLSALMEKECALNALWRCAVQAGGWARWS